MIGTASIWVNMVPSYVREPSRKEHSGTRLTVGSFDHPNERKCRSHDVQNILTSFPRAPNSHLGLDPGPLGHLPSTQRQ